MIPQATIDIVKRFEGFHRQIKNGTQITAVPYLCPAHFWTIGWGHLCKEDQSPITMEQGEILLSQDLNDAMIQTISLCPVLIGYENKLAAIISFTFNLGSGRLSASTLRRKINQKEWREAAEELHKWVWGGGRKLPGLITRRNAEAELFLT